MINTIELLIITFLVIAISCSAYFFGVSIYKNRVQRMNDKMLEWLNDPDKYTEARIEYEQFSAK